MSQPMTRPSTSVVGLDRLLASTRQLGGRAFEYGAGGARRSAEIVATARVEHLRNALALQPPWPA